MTVLNFGTTATVPQEFATLLVTLEEAHRSPGSFVRIPQQKAEDAVSAYRYSSENAEYSFLFAEAGRPWREGVVASDAGFVCWSQRPVNRLIFCNGSHAAIDGGPELRFERRVSWAEILLEPTGQRVFSSDPEAVQKDAVASDSSRHP
jgi:hypothetical protein